MNEESAKANLGGTRDGGEFSFLSQQQTREFEASITDIMVLMERVKSSQKSMTMTRRSEKKVKADLDGRSFRLMMSKPTKHLKKWCSSTHLSGELATALRAPTDADASGCIYSPWRDLPRTKEGQAKMAQEVRGTKGFVCFPRHDHLIPALHPNHHLNPQPNPQTLASFKPGEIGTLFGEPPIDSCSDSFQMMLERHLVKAVDRLRKEYGVMPWGTVKHSTLKGNVGRDLAALEERLEHCLSSQNVRSVSHQLKGSQSGGKLFSRGETMSVATPATGNNNSNDDDDAQAQTQAQAPSLSGSASTPILKKTLPPVIK